MGNAKTIKGDFELSSFEYCVTNKGKVPHDVLLGYQLKRRGPSGEYRTSPEREGFYQISAHPDAVAQLDQQLMREGLRGHWKALFHPLGSPSNTVWAWEMQLGQDEPIVAHQPQPQYGGPPVQYQPQQIPQQPQWAQSPQPLQVNTIPQQAGYSTQQPQAPYVPHSYPPGYQPQQPTFGTYDPRNGFVPLPNEHRYAPPLPQQYQVPAAPVVDSPELASLKAELAEMRRDAARRDAAERERERDAQQAKAQSDLLAEIRAVRADTKAELDALRRDQAAPKAQSTIEMITALATVLAPHFVSMRQQDTEKDKAAQLREQTLMQTMLERRSDPMVEKLLEKFDHLTNAAKGQPLSEQVAIMQAVSQTMFGSFSMSMKMLEQMTESMPQASPVKEIAGELLQGLKGMVETYARTKHNEAVRSQQQTHTATVTPQAGPSAPAAAAPQAFDLRTRDGMLGYLKQQGAPDDWISKPWASIVSALVRRDAVEDVASMLATHCYNLWKFEALPEALSALEAPADFEKPWTLVLSFMPIERDEETQRYLDAVVARAAELYREGRASEEDEAPAAAPNGAGAPTEVVPAVPAGAVSAAPS